MKDVMDVRPVVDPLWFGEDYLDLFAAAGLRVRFAPTIRANGVTIQAWVPAQKCLPKFDRFNALVGKVLSVPKDVLDQRLAEHEKQSKVNPKRRGTKTKPVSK